MAEPTTPLPPAKADGEEERAVLLGYLEYHRAVLARKAEGVSDADARWAACPPSELTLLGLIRHMTDVERHWFRRVLLADDAPSLYETADDPDADFHPPPEDGLADALDVYWAEIASSNATLAGASLDDRMRGGHDPGRHSLRRTIVHLVEEYARHCGHADLLRQAIDGSTGD